MPDTSIYSGDKNPYTFAPKITARFPLEDHSDHPLNPMVTQFCFPVGDIIQPSEYRMPSAHHFVMTNDKGRKVYGTCLTIYEEYQPTDNTPWQNNEKLHSATVGEAGIEVSVNSEGKRLYIPKCLCLLSIWPYVTAFREYLAQLYRLATSTDCMKAPIERYVMNLCMEIPAPPPGSFEVKISILDSVIRFWSPPAKLPIAYVALPYQILFDCLDIENILHLWYCLTMERKIILVSSQHSILTVCSEILCSLLYPMKWSHLYVPLLPKFLCPILDAPVPYLCGVTRDNWMNVQKFVCDEAIVVDLDRNSIMFGQRTMELPPVPGKKWSKLQHSLQEIAGHLFWKGRGLETEYQEFVQNKISQCAFKEIAKEKGERVWREKLQTLDQAFNLQYTPDSENLSDDTINDREQNQWDRLQEAFLRFFVAILKDYRKCVHVPDKSKLDLQSSSSPDSKDWLSWGKNHRFDTDSFITSQKSEYFLYLSELCSTQQFDDFITKRLYSPELPDIIFFDQSIDAKLNRSRLKLKKVHTPFLQSAKVHKQLETFVAVEPNTSDLFEEAPFIYETWPEKFDSSLFCRPRPIPGMITAEFDRQASLVKQLQKNYSVDKSADLANFYGSDYDYSPEGMSFTVFFFAYSAIIGREWQEYQSKRDEIENEIPVANSKVVREKTAEQEIRAVAVAQLDLAFDALQNMETRGLRTDPDVFKSLMEACGRCGDTKRAFELIEIMKRDGLVANSDVLAFFVASFAQSRDDQESKNLPSGDPKSDAYSLFLKKNLNKMKGDSQRNIFGMKVPSDEESVGSDGLSDNGSELSIEHATSAAFLQFFASNLTNSRTKKKKKRRRNKKASMIQTEILSDRLKKQLVLGESLLDFLYPDIFIDTYGDACPSCSNIMKEEDIVSGWQQRDFQDFTTSCPLCSHRFVSRFKVSCSSPTFEGSQGPGTPLYCEFLSPWVLRKELSHIIGTSDSIEQILNPAWRSGRDVRATIWWNLIAMFKRYKLPFSFLLQGSFRNRLINPVPQD
ncbi:DENN-domain-containing protein [Fragilariopsis cylindrus CCMP1102]|uniref:DENN-domain-containing protein n=1 Tax=Fragilariopsis cylindrus CCMP1102 TaxID=635003 RepID=A0A1E7EUT4_9STRA|nr:DENN-domain-containing protein [Fragilariopsis cylindrus CCMP1102]|eukprot:OEU09619.1 DENN-domain-containing protein [Fragilariopsis cylindrus CCMP1102]